MKNERLKKYLDKRINQPTVILCFKILLSKVIKDGLHIRMSKSEIHKSFDKQHTKFGVQTFRSDYLLRQTGRSELDAIGVEDEGKLFFVRPLFLKDVSIEEMIKIVNNIDKTYLAITAKHRKLYEEISSAKHLSIEKRKEFITYMLFEKETDRKGQSFEVTAFAILKAYYEIRGFGLNRFSTIYSNDGGIDYTSQYSIYQVTNNMSNKKFDTDILKAPLKKRIFVFKDASANFDYDKMEHELVSDYISGDDLLEHLDYMLKKKPSQNSSLVLEFLLKEFEREYYMN